MQWNQARLACMNTFKGVLHRGCQISLLAFLLRSVHAFSPLIPCQHLCGSITLRYILCPSSIFVLWESGGLGRGAECHCSLCPVRGRLGSLGIPTFGGSSPYAPHSLGMTVSTMASGQLRIALVPTLRPTFCFYVLIPCILPLDLWKKV